jgi:hypothetical protein
MKQLTTKLLLAFFLILSNIQIFAQTTTPTDPPAGADPAAPIDSNIIVLAIAAIILSFIFVMKKIKKTA